MTANRLAVCVLQTCAMLACSTVGDLEAPQQGWVSAGTGASGRGGAGPGASDPPPESGGGGGESAAISGDGGNPESETEDAGAVVPPMAPDAGDPVPAVDGGSFCSPGSSRCDGDDVSTCTAAGDRFESSVCPDEAPHCTGAGECVACRADADCAAASCQVAVCDLTRATCGVALATPGTACDPEDSTRAGQCLESGKCAPIVNILSNGHGSYVGSTDTGPGYLKAYQSSPGPWERFLLVRDQPTDSRVAFISLRSNQYVVPVEHAPFDSRDFPETAKDEDNADARWLGANGRRTDYELSSSQLGGATTIKLPGGNFWSAEDWVYDDSGEPNRPVRVRTSTEGPWERFTILPTD